MINFVNTFYFVQNKTWIPLKKNTKIQKILPKQIGEGGKHFYFFKVCIAAQILNQFGGSTKSTFQAIMVGNFAINLVM